MILVCPLYSSSIQKPFMYPFNLQPTNEPTAVRKHCHSFSQMWSISIVVHLNSSEIDLLIFNFNLDKNNTENGKKKKF